VDAAAVLLHHAVHGGQPEAGTLPGGLRGEEGLEHVRARLLVHADPGVTHREADVLARPHRPPCLALIFGQVHAPGLDPQHAAVRHRIAGIGDEVEEDLLRGVHIGAHVGEVVLARGDDLDVGRQDTAQEPGQIADQAAEVDRLELEAGAAGEPEQLLHHHAAPQSRRHHVPQVGLGIRLAGRKRLRDQLGVREDDGEQIVEVVSDAAGELADRLHLLGLAQLLLERAPLRHVLRDRLEAVDRAVGAPHRAAGEADQDLLAVPALPHDLLPFDHVFDLEAAEDALALVRVRVHVDAEWRSADSARHRSVMSVPTPITPATAPSASRTGEYHASNTTPKTSTVDENISPVRARRTSASACGSSANISKAERPMSRAGRTPTASSPPPSTIVTPASRPSATSTRAAPAMTVRSRSWF